MTFDQCVLYCFDNAELRKQFEKLTGQTLRDTRAPIEMMVDGATGHERPELVDFIAFVWEVIWCRLPDSAFSAEPNE